jgi:hypothetical protein
MSSHRREYFVSRLRTGIAHIKVDGLKLKVYTPTVDDSVILSEVYCDTYDKCIEDGFMDDEELIEWMIGAGLWSKGDDDTIKAMESNITKLKKQAYLNRQNPLDVDKIRATLDKTYDILLELRMRKNAHLDKTPEGLASICQARKRMRLCTYLNGELYDFSMVDEDDVLREYQSTILTETTLRELCRNDPWKTVWYFNTDGVQKMFSNEDGRDLSPNQQNMVIWSKMYDSIYESVDCPSESVINDDLLIDGWSIVQREKRESEQAKNEIDSGSKTHQADEVYVVAQNRDEAKKVNMANSKMGSLIKKQRSKQLKGKGIVKAGHFHDEQVQKRNEGRG